MDSQKLFGKRIKELRKRANFTQEQIAELLGIYQKQVGNIETGTTFTTMANLEKLADVFGVEVKELFDFSHKKSRDEIIREVNSIMEFVADDKLELIYRLVKVVVK